MGSTEIGLILDFVGPFVDFFGGFADAVGDGFSAISFFVGSLGEAAELPTEFPVL